MSPYIQHITPLVCSTVRFDPQRGWRFCTEDSNCKHIEFGSGKCLATDGVIAVFQPTDANHAIVVQHANLKGRIVSYIGVKKAKHIKLRKETAKRAHAPKRPNAFAEAMRLLDQI